MRALQLQNPFGRNSDRSQRSRHHTKRHRRFELETLLDRTLLSVAISAAGIITATDTNASPRTITVDSLTGPGRVVVTDDTGPHTYFIKGKGSQPPVTGIVIDNTNPSASDIVNVWSNGGVRTNIIGRAPETVNVGFNGSVKGITKALNIYNQANVANSTTINIDDSSDTAQTITTLSTRANPPKNPLGAPFTGTWGRIAGRRRQTSTTGTSTHAA